MTFTRLAAALVAGALSCAAWAAPIPTLRDADGRPALMGTPATRVATLAPSLTELVYAAGVGDKLVAVSAYSDYPPAARTLPVVADATGIAMESLMRETPDLVLSWKGGTREVDVMRLTSAGINVFSIDVRKLDDVPLALRHIGRLTGRFEPAETRARAFESELARVRRENAGKPRVKAFFEMTSKPWLTINRDHFLSEAMAVCGGENVFADVSQIVFTPSKEMLLTRGADVIFYAKSSVAEPGFDAASYEGLAAVRNGFVFPLTADFALRPGPRLLLAVGEICAALDRVRAGKPILAK